jgi:H+/gluconate symporter-like permease
MGLQVFAIVLSLVLLMAFAYRGLPVIVFAPIFALLAAGLSGRPLLPSYTESFMGSAADYVKAFFPIFLLGAIFGKLMETSGAAGSIAAKIVGALGAGRAILAVVLSCAVLTYGGVSLFVVAFAVYPLAAVMFREADIPKRLIPGTIALGAFTFTMDALPGSPQIQNVIPTRYFGTDAYAAPIVGTAGGTAIFLLGMLWLERRRRSARAAGEGYGEGHRNEPDGTPVDRHPHLILAVLPLLVVLGANYLLSRSALSVATWYPEEALRSAFPTIAIKAVVSTWALIVALVLGIATTILLHAPRVWGRLTPSLSLATSGALLAIFNTASEVGFGNVIKTMPGFRAIQGWVLGASRYPLVSEAVAVNVLAGITGSASGGLSIALDVMSKHYLELARAQGISPDLLHRIASMASGGMDTLPHNGAVITLLAITGLTHRQSYPDIFAITLIKTATVFVLAFAVSLVS